jgi:isopenicillin-N N-acyltransferase-like protein
MTEKNYDFPYIKYDPSQSYREWGMAHGESYREGIKELYQIRKELMLAKNPALASEIEPLSQLQFNISKKFAPEITEELEGIAQGSNLTIAEIVILNNYTDFRDIQLPEEGCSTVHVQNDDEVLTGQTWDMHGSAKRFVNIIHVPKTESTPESLVFSLIGCVGLMGINTNQNLIGVNNINTANAQAGLIWPVLVRKVLKERSLQTMRTKLTSAPVTSGHNYLISSPQGGEHWEITPTLQEKVASLGEKERGEIFHTNHCLGEQIKRSEDPSSLSSTTHVRYDLLGKKTSEVKTFDQLKSLLMDHEGYPKSICSHFQSGAQDPSMTCGGGIADFKNKNYYFWRGCPVHDSDFKSYSFVHKTDEQEGHFELANM